MVIGLPSSMYFRLSRIAFWLAAAAAAWALVAPSDRTLLAIGVAACAGAVALVLRWIGEHAPPAEAEVPDAPLTAPLDSNALQEAADVLVRAVQEALFFDAALHAAARVLRNELGALEFSVIEVRELGEEHALIAEAIESQPGFHAVARRIRLDTTALCEALRTQREVARESSVAVPVSANGEVIAAIQLEGIALAIEPEALANLLRLTRLLLSERAPRRASTEVPTIDADAAQVERINPLIPPSAHPPVADSGMLAGLAERADRNRLRALDVDDPLSKLPSSPGSPSADPMFSQVNPPAHAGVRAEPHPAVGAGAGAFVGSTEPLDPAALARLTELDPSGAKGLLERVLRAYQNSANRLRAQGEVARRDGDRAALRLVVHTLKSSSASVGALQLSRLCAQIETRIRLEDSVSLDADLDAMDAALDAALQAIAQLLEPTA